MNHITKKFNTAANQVNITSAEQAGIKARLMAAMAANPATDRSTQRHQSPVQNPAYHVQKSIVSPFLSWMQMSVHIRSQYVGIFLVTLIVLGGVSSAAERALPGDSLYEVKTSVNENIRSLFSLTPQSKAQLHVELAVRRLEEAEKLAVTGKLDTMTKDDVEKKLDQHLAVINDTILTLEEAIATDPSATEAIGDAGVSTANTLMVTEAPVSDLSDEPAQPIAPSSAPMAKMGKKMVSPAATDVNPAAATNDTAPDHTAATFSMRAEPASFAAPMALTAPSAEPVTPAATSATMSVSIAHFASSSDSSVTSGTTSPSTISATTTESVLTSALESKFAEATAVLKQGSAKISARKYGEAAILFQKAQRLANEIRVDLDARTASSTASTTPAASVTTSASSTAATDTASTTTVIKQ